MDEGGPHEALPALGVGAVGGDVHGVVPHAAGEQVDGLRQVGGVEVDHLQGVERRSGGGVRGGDGHGVCSSRGYAVAAAAASSADGGNGVADEPRDGGQRRDRESLDPRGRRTGARGVAKAVGDEP